MTKERETRGTSPMALALDNNNHSTRPLCYEQLLIGRRAGAYAGEKGEEIVSERREVRWCTSTHPPPLQAFLTGWNRC